ncbi:MAG: helix-turn-helix domain-containing protein, partial [Acidimicrobiia bacterium]|nr:helix-turn-helix domain-containing protein [Acidimicrobiia bacterium]
MAASTKSVARALARARPRLKDLRDFDGVLTPTQKDLVSVRSQLRYEKRRTAVEAVRNGESASTVARVMKVPLRTLFSWIARYRLGGEQALQEGRRSGR